MNWEEYQRNNGIQVRCTMCGCSHRISEDEYRGDRQAECPECGALDSWED